MKRDKDQAWPSYSELLMRGDAPAGSSWGLFGDGDNLGTLNFLSDKARQNARNKIKTGQAYSLDLPSDRIYPSLAPTRQPIEHHIFQRNEFHHDEWLDKFYTQYGSQIDGLRHIGHPDFGFYNGNDPATFKPGTEPLSIHHFTAAPIAGRGVLIDVARYVEEREGGLDYIAGQPVSIDLVEKARVAQRISIEPGDIVMIRFGWLDFYLNKATPEYKKDLVNKQFHAGLVQSHETVAWLWDNKISLIAADNFALEAWPAPPNSPFYTSDEGGCHSCGPHAGIMHRAIIALLGMPIGELWQLDDLARDCAADNRYDCLVTVSPLPLVGGVGSPANAIAIR